MPLYYLRLFSVLLGVAFGLLLSKGFSPCLRTSVVDFWFFALQMNVKVITASGK
jgi:hypothetical protein